MERSCICRTCMKKVEPISYLFINNYAKTQHFENLQIRQIIEKCAPEIDLDITENPMICYSCYDLLISTFIFKSKFLQTEEKIYVYIEKNNLELGDKIDLYDVFKTSFTISSVEVHVKDYASEISDIDVDNQEITILNSGSQESEDSKISICESEEKETKLDIQNPELVDGQNIEHEHANIGESLTCSRTLYEKRTYTCDKCEYKGSRGDLLKQHLKICGKVKEEFHCNDCSYKTFRKRNLKRHTLIHGGQRPYICGLCNKGFTEKNHLKIHMYKHTGEDLPFKCKEGNCTSSFARKCDLNAHIMTHISFNLITCKFCGKGFSRKKQQSIHLKTCLKRK